MLLHEEITIIRGRLYKIEIQEFFLDKTPCWVAYRDGNGGWEHIPTSTQGEENRFPKTVGMRASSILKNYLANRKEKEQ